MIFPRGGTGRTGFLTAGWFLVDFPLFRLPYDHALKLLEKNPEKSRGWQAGEARASPVYLRMQLSQYHIMLD